MRRSVIFIFLLLFLPCYTLAEARDSLPLIIYDGEIFDGSMDDIDTTELARITRVNSEQAIQLYGEQGKNGAIILISEDFLHPNIITQVKNAKLSTKICLSMAVCLSIVLLILIFLSMKKDKRYSKHNDLEEQAIPKNANISNASLLIRGIEHLIDRIIIQSGLIYVLIWQIFGPLFFYETGIFYLFLITWGIFSAVLYFAYYYFGEYYFGRTIGKWICGTHVISQDGSSPSALNIAKRTIRRFAPYEAFSFLFTEIDENGKMVLMWHDECSQTRVVKCH